MAKHKTLRFQPAGGDRSASVPVGKKQRLQIERLATDGRGIAHLEGRAWFVAGALAGEEVEVRVLAARSKVVEARVERVLSASALRREPTCAVAGRCGGCTLQHLPHAEQLSLKQQALADQLQRLAGIAPEQWVAALTADEYGYRRRTRISVRWDAKSRVLEVGFRAASSAAIVPLVECPVLVQPLQLVARQLPACLKQFSKPERIGHVELFHGSVSALLLRHTGALADADQALLRSFCAEHALQLWWQGEGEPEPDQPGAELSFALQAEGLELSWRPGDFVQVNPLVNERMVEQALDWLAPQAGERVLDLFCGLGNFALPLARRCAEVVAVEGVDVMVQRARGNAERNGLGNIAWHCADLGQPLLEQRWLGRGFDAVLLDPPRDGALAVVRELGRLGAPRVVYVSCNPATLARDAAELLKQGYRLRRAGILDMFPQTAHVEAMALFERV